MRNKDISTKALIELILRDETYLPRSESVLLLLEDISGNTEFARAIDIVIGELYLALLRKRLFEGGHPERLICAKYGYQIPVKKLKELGAGFHVSLAKTKKCVAVLTEYYEGFWEEHQVEALKIMEKIKTILKD